jgi:hypothetical protein
MANDSATNQAFTVPDCSVAKRSARLKEKRFMLPLVGIAASLVPELIRLISTGKTNAPAADVSRVLTDTFGIQDEPRARAKLANSAIGAQLQTRPAEIALDAYKVQVEAYSEQRQTDLDKLGAFLADTQGARSLTTTLADKGSPIGWGAPVISLIIGVGFLMALGMTFFGGTYPESRVAAH